MTSTPSSSARTSPASPRSMAEPSLLIASGLDPSGGAGFIADIRGAQLAGVRPVGVLTALTVQDTRGVRRSTPVDPDLLREQLSCVLGDIEVTAVKIGLVPGLLSARALADGLAQTAAPVVWDPVVSATAGGTMTADPLPAFAEILAAESTLVTPNLLEAAELLGHPVADPTTAALTLADALACAVLLKGGHADPSSPDVIDILARAGTTRELRHPRVPGPSIHGTGCFLSPSIAAELARGLDLDPAIDTARRLLADRLRSPTRPGRGAPSTL